MAAELEVALRKTIRLAVDHELGTATFSRASGIDEGVSQASL
jgi:hypothetical protein